MKTPDYLSYERYKKRKGANSNKRFFMFVVTFFVTLLAFSVVVKLLDPDVDVSIGGDTEVEAKDTGLGVKSFIDERLKIIEQDDNSPGVSSNRERITENQTASTDYKYDIQEEKLSLPETKPKQVVEEPVMPSYEQITAPPRPSAKTSSSNAQNQVSRVSKVYVGKYSTVEQARVAQEILMDSGIGVTPFIKEVGGSYTLQLGSFSSRTKAEDLSAQLKKNGFPARISEE